MCLLLYSWSLAAARLAFHQAWVTVLIRRVDQLPLVVKKQPRAQDRSRNYGAEPQACRSMKADFSCFSLSSMASAASWVLPCSFWVKHEGVKTRNRLPYWLPAGSALASQVE